MRAVVVHHLGGPEVLLLRSHPVPEPGPGEVLAALGLYGHLVYFGESSGSPAPIHPDELYGRCLRVSAFWLSADPPERWNTARRELQDQIVGGTLRVTIGQTFSLQEAPRAHRELESRATHGKLVLQVS